MASRKEISWTGWEVVRRIGSGSFGAVYEIQREIFGDVEKAALKVISIPYHEEEVDYLRCSGLGDADITRTFHEQVGDIAKEYKMMARLRENPNIVRCDDFSNVQHEDGLGWDIYIKMELLTPLMKCLDRVATEEQIITMAIDICNALIACQEKNIIHRDIKPQNVFFSESGRFKLGDFGIARTMERVTHATAGIGTYSYMAPEVERNEPYGKTADIYSLGLMMYWLLNERRGPFMPLPPGVPKYGDEEETRRRRFSGEKLPPPKNGSEALKAIVLRACSFKPEDRFESACEMQTALNDLLGDPGRSPVFRNVSTEARESFFTELPDNQYSEEDDRTVGPVFDSTVRNSEEQADPDATVGPDFTKKTAPGVRKPVQNSEPIGVNTISKNIKKKKILRCLLVILLAAIVYVSCAEALIERIITGNVMITVRCEDFRPQMKAINNALVALLGGKFNAHGIIVTRLGIILNPSYSATSLANAWYLILPSFFFLLLPIMAAVWYFIRQKRKKNGGANQPGILTGMVQLVITLGLYWTVGETLLSRIIMGNIILASRCASVRAPIQAINNVLKVLTDATTIGQSSVSTRFGVWLSPSVSASNIANACYLILPALFVLILPPVLLAKDIWKHVMSSRNALEGESEDNE